MEYTAKDISLLKQHNKRIRMKIKLLDSETYQEVDNLTGNVVSASYNKSYSSNIRSTCSLTLSVPQKDKLITDFEKTWNKRMVELYCGIYDEENQNYREYNLGRMLMQSGSTKLDSTTQEIQLSLVDLMASLTKERGSQIGSDTHIPATEQGVKIDVLIKNIIDNFATFKLSNICEFDDTLPYDLDFGNGIYPIEMLNKILELFPYYEMFYNENGVFTVQQIPTNIDDPIYIDKDILDELIINESRDSNFTNIKNTTEIWGKELECDYASSSCILSGDVYNVTIDDSFTTLKDGETFAVLPNSASVNNQKMNIQNLGEYYVYTMSGSGTYSKISAGDMMADTPYQIRYTQSKYVLVGELLVRCIVQEITEMPSSNARNYYKSQNNCNNVQWVVNPDSTYACTLERTTGRIIGEIKQVLSGGEYDDIYSTALAYERAKYENWLKCRLQDTISLQTILIPWIDVNKKIRFTSPSTGDVGTWIVQSVDFNFDDWTMDIKASRFYPYYPW